MDLYEMQIDEENGYIGVYAMSLVKNPAIRSGFVALADTELVKLAVIEGKDDRRLLLGAALIPDFPILRVDPETGDKYQIYFTKETVEKAAHAYIKNGFQNEATMHHTEQKLQGVHTVESWVKTSEHDKSKNHGLDLPIGTWFILQHIEDEDLWREAVKKGEVLGFSLEGRFKPVPKQQLSLMQEIEDACIHLKGR